MKIVKLVKIYYIHIFTEFVVNITRLRNQSDFLNSLQFIRASKILHTAFKLRMYT